MAYYDGTKLLSMKDINGKNPELFMVTTNRTVVRQHGSTVILSRSLRTDRVSSALSTVSIMSYQM